MKKVYLAAAISAVYLYSSAVPATAAWGEKKFSSGISSGTVIHLFGRDLITEAFDGKPLSWTPFQIWVVDRQLPKAKLITGLALNLGWERHGIPDLVGAEAGFVNVADKMWGLQAGLINGAEKVHGVQAGLLNATDRVYGAQGGLLNAADKAFGIQAGLVNGSDDVYGFQLALIGSAADRVYGVQAGIVNTADKVRGLQLGIVNICDRLSGLQIGVLNIAGSAPLPIMVGLNAGF